MSSSPKSADERRILLVAEAGVPYVSVPAGDPIAAWIDLMEVVEALCPKSPPRPPLVVTTGFRL
jgi:hypothetical protein